jgi:hypothetical protein
MMNLSRINLSQTRYPQYMAPNDGLAIIIAMGFTQTSGSRKMWRTVMKGFRSSIVMNLEVLEMMTLAMTDEVSE